jgi:RNA polymerase sigma-32 factor
MSDKFDSKKNLSPVKPTVQTGQLKKNDPLQSYLDEIRKYPLLSREEERELATHYFKNKDQASAQKLVTSNLRFVVKVAAEYSKFGSKLIDLIQEGNVGLMHAVREFNPHKDVKLITYAVWWIRGHIQEYLMKQHSMVKIGTTNNQKKLYYKLNKEKELLIREGLEPSVKLLSARLGVEERDVKLMQTRLGAKDVSLDQPIRGVDDNSSLLDLQRNSDHKAIEDNINLKENLEMLEGALAKIKGKLTKREKLLLKERILSDNPKTLNELGEEAGVTREAIRQSEERLMKKIKAAFVDLNSVN